MTNTYITALAESLEKKIKILEEIHSKDEEQLKLIKAPDFSFDAYDANAEEKSVLIYKLTKLDEGFELTYEKVREELDINRAKYADEIKKIQDLIRKITELDVTIKAEEQRNKTALEAMFKSEKDKIKAQRSGAKAMKSYAQAMNSYKIF